MTTMTETDDELIPWRKVTLCYGQCGDDAEDIDEEDPRRVTLLREYRESESIALGWLCSAEELVELEDGSAVDVGPTVAQIDWTGFPDDE